jgi:hypothetical protein
MIRMTSGLRCLVLAVVGFGLLPVACFNSSSKTTNVKPGATSPQPAECLAIGVSCHSSDDCCSGSCNDNVCVEKK